MEDLGSGSWGPDLLRPRIRKYVGPALLDGLLGATALCLALGAHLGGRALVQYLNQASPLLLLVALAQIGSNSFRLVYSRLWRYATLVDLAALGEAAVLATLLSAAAHLLLHVSPRPAVSQIVLQGFIAFFLMLLVRSGHVFARPRRTRQSKATNTGTGRSRALIVGANTDGFRLAQYLLDDPTQCKRYEAIGFVDNDEGKTGSTICGLKVMGIAQDIPEIVAREGVEQIMIALRPDTGNGFDKLLSICRATPAQIRTLPPLGLLLDGQPAPPSSRPITIDDVLGRSPVGVDEASCRASVKGRVVLVTGAGGSIGSELCRQLLKFEPKRLLLVDNNESGLHNLHRELQDRHVESRKVELSRMVADITEARKMESIFRYEAPEIVFHAAAYKHVPLMEADPDEAVRVNVQGTLILTELAEQYAVGKFVLISTDKAVNPSCVMGATKRLGELWIAAMQEHSRTQFSCVRFGNVLGSRGSVVELFETQMLHGGPVTVTDPKMTRYFMSIPEAASLVIQAAAFDGEGTYMLDMGQPIRIMDLALKMIRLRGLRPSKDIRIKVIGARPGEKLDEELSYPTEEKRPTLHPSISRLVDHAAPDKDDLLQYLAVLMAASEGSREMKARLGKSVILAANGDLDGCLRMLMADDPGQPAPLWGDSVVFLDPVPLAAATHMPRGA